MGRPKGSKNKKGTQKSPTKVVKSRDTIPTSDIAWRLTKEVIKKGDVGKRRRNKIALAEAFLHCNGDWQSARRKAGLSPNGFHGIKKDCPDFIEACEEAFREKYDDLQHSLVITAVDKALDGEDRSLFELLSAINPKRWDTKVRAARERNQAPSTVFVNISHSDLLELQSKDPAFIDVTEQGELPDGQEGEN